MDDNRKLARELFLAIEDTTESMPDDIDRIAAYGEARYKAGVEDSNRRIKGLQELVRSAFEVGYAEGKGDPSGVYIWARNEALRRWPFPQSKQAEWVCAACGVSHPGKVCPQFKYTEEEWRHE